MPDEFVLQPAPVEPATPSSLPSLPFATAVTPFVLSQHSCPSLSTQIAPSSLKSSPASSAPLLSTGVRPARMHSLFSGLDRATSALDVFVTQTTSARFGLSATTQPITETHSLQTQRPSAPAQNGTNRNAPNTLLLSSSGTPMTTYSPGSLAVCVLL